MRTTSALVAILTTLLLMTGCDSRTPEEHLAEGRAQLQAGAADVAMIEFKNAAQKAPELAVARFELGRLHLQRGEIDDALDQLRRAETLGFDAALLRLPLSRARLVSRDADEIEALRTDLQNLPESERTPSLGAILAAAEATAGDEEAALERLYRLIREHPDNLDVRLTMARVELAGGRLQSAIGQAEAATELAPDDEAGWAILGQARLTNGDFAQAAEAYEHARRTPGSNGISAGLGLARARMGLNEIDAAARIIDDILERVPGLTQAQYLSAVIAATQNEGPRALEALGQVLAAVPGHLPSLYLRGTLFLNEGASERAIADLERVVAAQPGNARARLAAAAAFAQLGQFDESVDLLEAGRSMVIGTPLEAGYVAALGQVQVRAGNASDGLEALARAVELQPDAARLRTQLAVAHLLSGEAADAEAELAAAADLADAFPASRALLILVQLRSGKSDEALASALAYVADEPESAAALNLLGSVRLSRRELREAEAALRSAVEKDAQFTPAWLNLAGLEASRDKLDEARNVLEGILAYDPVSNSALERLLDVAIAQKDAAAARAAIEGAVRQDETNVANLLLLVRLERELGNDEAAFLLLDDRTFEGGMPTPIRRARAELALATGRPDAALRDLRALAKQNPDDPGIGGQLALAMLRSGRLEEASDLLEDLLHRVDEAPSQLLALSTELLIRRGELRRAGDRLEELRKRSAATYAVNMLDGDLAIAQGDPAAAVGFYDAALETAPSTSIVRKLYFAQQAAGDQRSAEQTVRDRLAEEPDDLAIRFILAQHLMSTGDLAESAQEYGLIDAASPDQAAVLNNLAWLHDQLGRADALDLARRAVALAPQAPQVLDTLGWMLVRRQHAEEARDVLARAVEGAPSDPEIRYHYAVALADSGAVDTARNELRTALTSGDFAARRDAEALLRDLK